jgi:L-serine dehydratase
MAPKRAAEKFLAKNLHVHRFRVSLFESLAATGKGHLSDLVLKETFTPAPVEIVWKPEQRLSEHPNGMLFEAFDKSGNTLDSWKVYSVGGGALREEGAQISSRPVYALRKMNDIMDHCIKGEIAFWRYVEQSEGTSIWDYLETVWHGAGGLSRAGSADARCHR